MNRLLQSLIVTPTGSIRWDKLDQFISISSNADAVMQGDFQALKQAQGRSDLMKTYGARSTTTAATATTTIQLEEEETGEVSQEATLQILDYLLSDSGRFLREPLLNEIVETIDALGITAASVLSLVTNRIVPTPPEKPDKTRV